MFGEEVKKDDEQSQESDHTRIPRFPGIKKRGLFFRIRYHFIFFEFPRFAMSMAAISPSINPSSIPMVTFLMSRPIAIPVTMAMIKAMSLRFRFSMS
jgi:hypothetical protein